MKVQERLAKIQRELKAPKDKKNSFGGYNYRNAEGILEAVKPLLDGATVTVDAPVQAIGNHNYVVATAAIHEDGETISVQACAREAETKKGMDDAQITGAATSYAKKYALSGLFAIDDSSEDPDQTNRHEETATTSPKPAHPSKPAASHQKEREEVIGPMIGMNDPAAVQSHLDQYREVHGRRRWWGEAETFMKGKVDLLKATHRDEIRHINEDYSTRMGLKAEGLDEKDASRRDELAAWWSKACNDRWLALKSEAA